MVTATIQDVDADVDAEHPFANLLKGGELLTAAPFSYSRRIYAILKMPESII